MLSKEIWCTIFWVFCMTQPGIELWSLGPLANTLPIVPCEIYRRMSDVDVEACFSQMKSMRWKHTDSLVKKKSWVYQSVKRSYWPSSGIWKDPSLFISLKKLQLSTVLVNQDSPYLLNYSSLRIYPTSPHEQDVVNF